MHIKKLIPKILLHITIILFVVIFPVIVYEFMLEHQYYKFLFIGGISYFIYVFYLVLRIKNHCAKIILLGILYSIATIFIGIIFSDINEFSLIISLIINLIIQYFLLIKNPKSTNPAIRRSYLISFIVTIILSILGACFWILMLAASGLPSNHY